ncbi:MAG: TIGR02680 family protein [Desulfitobacterium sp.]|nr:TIGR02680 family protein [Desulfitobacterium sp.]
MGWQLARAGLFNFWYYDEEEFHFADGKLLLRGSNGSGKSVTMQSLIPVLLDGRKSPDRLDPFGSRARRMEDYLLGEKEVSDLDERTGYLYLEYQRPGTEQYLTTGMGLKAKRHSPLDSWGFIIMDNRRIGKEIKLYKTERTLDGELDKIPLTRRELTNVIGEGGEVLRTQQEYMERVNRHLFGFKSIDDFNDLIKLLIQLRSPKLSKEFRPTVVYDILNESLPSIADEELRPLSDTIENMDQIKSQLDQLEKEEESLKRLVRHYESYNRVVLMEKAGGLVEGAKRYEELTQSYEDLKIEQVENLAALSELRDLEEELRREQRILTKEKESLESHDVFKAEREKLGLIERKNKYLQELSDKKRSLDEKTKQERDLRDKLTSLETQERELIKEIQEELDELDYYAAEAEFYNHEVAAHEFEKQDADYSFALWQKETKDYYNLLDRVIQSLRKEEQAKEKYQEAEIELGDAKKAWDEAQYQEKKWNELLEEERRGWVANLFAWHENNRELRLEDIAMQTMTQNARSYPESVNLDQLREPVREAWEKFRGEIDQEILEVTHERRQILQEIKGKEEEINVWRQMKDPEPQRHPLTKETRNNLAKQKIPFVPFYGAVEFREDISEETRERLENALKNMGILDALIIPQEYHEKLNLSYDRILKPNPQILAHTLAKYLYPTLGEECGVKESDVDNILRSILVKEGLSDGEAGSGVATDGSYRIGLIQGHAPQEEVSQYIGKEARRQLRLREIAKLETQKEELNDILLELEGELGTLKERRSTLEEEYQSLPNEQAICEAFDLLDEARREVKNLEKDVLRKDEKLKETLDIWRGLKAQVKELTKSLSLPLNIPTYEKARDLMGSYQDGLSKLVTINAQKHGLKGQIGVTGSYLEDTCEAVDELRGQINSIESELQTIKQSLELIESRLKELGAAEIRAKINHVVKRLEELPKEIEESIRKISNLENKTKDYEEQIKKAQEARTLAYDLQLAWAKVFQEEENLQASHGDRSNGTSEESKNQGDELKALIIRAEQILKEKALGESGRNLDRENLREKVNEAYTREIGNLVEYRLTQKTIFNREDEDLNIKKELPELWRKLWEELYLKARRVQLVLEYNGKQVNPFYLRNQLEQNIILQQQLLNDKDRELYEEIIMNSVGRIIRSRIQRAEHWVDEMNKLMDERDTSSGLRLRIRWKPRRAEHEEEMDTQNLVELLKTDPRLLKESDMSQITNHFRAKIERAKEQLEIKGFGESFHQIIKEILDYRQWFEFRLLYLKEGESWRELTDRAFNKFSGGEKAMAMYIPLFSAAYSRYSDASPDAPRIITLDEAFAGVDENNIRDMFDLLEKLELNYIMNSQALWGDYDTVSKLAIAELVRPKNAPYVTVIRYSWDGKKKRLIA